MSRQRRQLIECGSMPSSLPWSRWASIIAASRLLAAVIAWMSPVKWRLISSIGTTCARPPPAPPPLIPNTGPSDGSRRQRIGLSPITAEALRERDRVVVLPSPNCVGVIAVTETIRPSGSRGETVDRGELDLGGVAPVRLDLVGSRPSDAASSAAGRARGDCGFHGGSLYDHGRDRHPWTPRLRLREIRRPPQRRKLAASAASSAEVLTLASSAGSISTTTVSSGRIARRIDSSPLSSAGSARFRKAAGSGPLETRPRRGRRPAAGGASWL